MKTIAEQLNIKEFPLEIRHKNGSLIYFENSDGFWIKWEYDSDGNNIYFENSNRYWVRREFDSNGNNIYFENSNRYWYKCEFDSVGRMIYYEDSTGLIKDKRCENKVVEIDGIKYKLTAV